MRRFSSLGKRGALVLFALAIAVSTAFVIFVSVRGRQPPHTVHWVAFTDPNGFYTVEVPRSWKAYHLEQGRIVDGVSPSGLNEFSFLHAADGTGITVLINVLAQDSLEARRSALCTFPENRSRPNAQIDGIPAFYLPIGGNSRELYIFSTTRADYQIGIRAFHSDAGKANPGDEDAYAHIVHSFKPIPAIPLQC